MTSAAARLPAWARPKDMVDLVRLAVPVAASRAAFMLMSLTDAVVLSRYNAHELPLVLNAWLPNGVFMGFGLGLMMGVSVMTAELNGSGKGQETGRIFRRGLSLAAGFSVVATAIVWLIAPALFDLLGFEPRLAARMAQTTQILALGTIGHMIGTTCQFYLEALRKPNIVTAINMSTVIVNLCSALILVPKYGAIGVVWGTTLSRAYMLVVFLVTVWLVTPAFKPSPNGPEGEAKRQNTVGLGTGIANIAEWGSFNLTFVIASKVSLDVGAIYGLGVQMMAVIFMIYVGLGTATSVRVAERYGRGDAAGVREAGRLGVVASTIVGVVLAVLLVLLREPLAQGMLNSSDPSTGGAALAPDLALLLGAIAFVTIFDGLQGVGSMALRAQGVVWTPTTIHVGSYVVVMVPLCWYLALTAGMGLWGVFVGITVASVLAGTLQIGALEWKAAREVRAGLPRAA
ncbi:MAG TPA: MATE family efflux transporter [Hyphomonadaceae bacterium]|nr:MATE family efflux transporter [Hyphomonadaceae bacterium]